MIAKFSVKKPYTVLVGVVLVIVLGIVSFTRMTTDLLTDIRNLTFTYTDKEENEEEIALGEIDDFEEGSSLNIINRDAQTRYISVTAGVDENHNVSLVSNSLEKNWQRSICRRVTPSK